MNIKAVLAKRQEEFIRSRVEIENWVVILFKQLSEVTLPETIGNPPGRTAKEIFPSLYEEKFDIEKYKAEFRVFGAWYQKVQQYADEVNRHALEVLNGNNGS